MWGVRLDSGDLAAQARQIRNLLDENGFKDARIMATNDLNEERISGLLAAGRPLTHSALEPNWRPPLTRLRLPPFTNWSS